MSAIEKKWNLNVVANYNRLLLLKAIYQSAKSEKIRVLTEALVDEWIKWCERIFEDLGEKSDKFYSLETICFSKIWL